MDDKYLSQFIIEAGKVTFTTPDGQQWRMRQPTPDEAANGFSAYRMTLEAILNDKHLAQFSSNQTTLEKEARVRANTAQALYLLPLLLEIKKEEEWQPAFNVFDETSMEKFEELAQDQAFMACWLKVLWGPILTAIREAKKKSLANSSVKYSSVDHRDTGHFLPRR